MELTLALVVQVGAAGLVRRGGLTGVAGVSSPAAVGGGGGGGGGGGAEAADVGELKRSMAELRERQAAMESTLQTILAAVQHKGAGD